jgi:hypothetical protein
MPLLPLFHVVDGCDAFASENQNPGCDLIAHNLPGENLKRLTLLCE